ncbi:MAG TPA: HEAT repeat domain-containing protein [Chthonomonadales bacterium]|nr:HEAT repeat domain-containing protein [Chthonomonadales bacterium]
MCDIASVRSLYGSYIVEIDAFARKRAMRVEYDLGWFGPDISLIGAMRTGRSFIITVSPPSPPAGKAAYSVWTTCLLRGRKVQKVFGDIPTEGAADLLRQNLQAAWDYGYKCPEQPSADDMTEIDRLVQQMRTARRATDRARAAEALGRIGQYEEESPIIDAFHDRNALVRAAAVRALGEHRRRKVYENEQPGFAIRSMVQDGSPSVRAAARWAIEQYHS